MSIQTAVNNGTAYLRKNIGNSRSGFDALGAYALLRAGVPPTESEIPLILSRIETKIQDGVYKPVQHHFYEAGVDLMALEAADAPRYLPQIQAIANYILENQDSPGSWFYPHQRNTGGDTSITQYALLGLWAAARAGVEVPADAWNRAAHWHLDTQLTTGAFVYHPKSEIPYEVQPTHSMTAAGTSSLMICKLHLFESRNGILRRRTLKGDKKFGVLERVEETGTAASQKPREITSSAKPLSVQQIDAGIQKGLGWLTERFTVDPRRRVNYYLYGVERSGALGNFTEIAGQDWYTAGASHLLKTQLRNGSWDGRAHGEDPAADTSFALLFLTKATLRAISHEIPTLSAGLLAGGRGLPDDLTSVDVKNGNVEVRKLAGDFDQLLLELENPRSTNVQSAQVAIVDTVQSIDREALVGQTDRLLKLVQDPRPDVRKTALWALGRTGDLKYAGVMVQALNDDDPGVLVEAHAGLCWLSRKPRAFNLPMDPLEDAVAGSDDEKRQALEKWRAAAIDHWGEWLLRARPYDQRNDLIELQSKQKR